MSEAGDFELFNAPAAKEGGEMSDEQFQEQMKRAQQQLKQLWQEEGQSRGQDYSLAAILVQFLSQPGNTDLFLLISRAVAQDIPSELILAVISLVDKKALDQVHAYLRGGGQNTGQAITSPASPHFQALPPEHKKVIDQWIANLHHVSLKKPHRTLQSLVRRPQPTAPLLMQEEARGEISKPLVQLSAFILRNYLLHFKIRFEFEPLHDFMQAVFVEIAAQLENLVKGQKQLRENTL